MPKLTLLGLSVLLGFSAWAQKPRRNLPTDVRVTSAKTAADYEPWIDILFKPDLDRGNYTKMEHDRHIIERLVGKWSWARAARRLPLRVRFLEVEDSRNLIPRPVDPDKLVMVVPHQRKGSTLNLAWDSIQRHSPFALAFILHHVVGHYYRENTSPKLSASRSSESLEAEGALLFLREFFRRTDWDFLPPPMIAELEDLAQKDLETVLHNQSDCTGTLRKKLN